LSYERGCRNSLRHSGLVLRQPPMTAFTRLQR